MVRAFVTSTGDAVNKDEARARLDAVDRLKHELMRQGAAVVDAPEQAQLVVEICGVYGAEEGPIVRSAKHAARLPARYRIVVLRLRSDDRRDDFACRDSASGVLAEQEAGDRIRRWWAERSPRSAFLLGTDEPLGMAAAS
jgi:hypothetical protein